MYLLDTHLLNSVYHIITRHSLEHTKFNFKRHKLDPEFHNKLIKCWNSLIQNNTSFLAHFINTLILKNYHSHFIDVILCSLGELIKKYFSADNNDSSFLCYSYNFNNLLGENIVKTALSLLDMEAVGQPIRKFFDTVEHLDDIKDFSKLKKLLKALKRYYPEIDENLLHIILYII